MREQKQFPTILRVRIMDEGVLYMGNYGNSTPCNIFTTETTVTPPNVTCL